MTNSWTGGQYSLFRALFGAHLFVQLVHLIRGGTGIFSDAGLRAETSLGPVLRYFPNPLFVWDSPTAVRSLLTIAAMASLAFAFGKRDRIAALVLWYVGACLFTLNPLITDPGPFFVGALLLGHALLPASPYGSWDARGRPDPGGGWRMRSRLQTAAWITLAGGYAFVGWTKLMSPEWVHGHALGDVLDTAVANPTVLREIFAATPTALWTLATWAGLAGQLLFAPLALIARIRPWLWLVSLGMNLFAALFIDVSEQSAGLMLLHCVTFDPGWITSRSTSSSSSGHTLVFYDGACGLCHRTIRFLLAEDTDGARFRFAPLDSDAFRSALQAPGSGLAADGTIPDSVLVRCPGEPMLARAEGVLEIGRQLGGLWRILAGLVGVIPLPILNAGYDFIARNRQHLFAPPRDACPVVPTELRPRFLS
jgi:predicted DCC family thiol-disulfide oxidoreductase YuxK